ncbi:MAG: 3-dehydroquinate synthase [Myxococcota bacterium]
MTSRSLVLSGFMATGKTTLGRALADRLGLPLLDTDAELERRTGQRIPELWQREGEGAFRRREAALVEEIFADPSPRVIAFGGGTATIRSARQLAIDHGFLVTLTASPQEIVRRTPDLSARPNLRVGDPVARAAELLEARAEAYAECHLRISTEAPLLACVSEILERFQEAPILMPLGRRSYTIEVGHNLEARIERHLARTDPSRVLVVTDQHLAQHQGPFLAAIAPGRPRTEIQLPPGEVHKTIDSVQRIWDQALDAGVDRHALVVAVGGGVIGDLAGFAAATLLRGLPVIQVPTTVLAIADASVGGKTGFDHPTGKNLIGAIHQPQAVFADLQRLETLPARERAAGLAEVVKIALTHEAPLVELLEREGKALLSGSHALTERVLRAAIEAKARVVREDELESGPRALLNFGHTIGHSLEGAGEYSALLHGEAVAMGMALELEFTAQRGLTPPALVARTRALLHALGLGVAPPRGLLSRAAGLVGADKKRSRDRVRLPVLRDLGRAELVEVPVAELSAFVAGAG